MKKHIKKLIKQRKGATAIEYALIAALVSVIALVAFKQLGYNIKEQVNVISQEVYDRAVAAKNSITGAGDPPQ